MLKRFSMVLSAAGLAMTVACSQSDPGITTAVKTKLAADDTVKAYQIDVDTANHVVTLSGNVDSPAAKEQAVMIARQTDGVSDVVDRIVIGPTPEATGGEVERKLDSAGDYIGDKAREGSDAVKDLAHDAKVKSENAASETGEFITDAAITSAVKSKFLADSMVSGLKIDVDTSNGVVTLNGTVKSNAEANKAVAIARESAGVKRVVNNLHVG